MRIIVLRLTILIVLTISILVFLRIYFTNDTSWISRKQPKRYVITDDSAKSSPTNTSCLFHTCFNVYNCGNNDVNKISVYVYPYIEFVHSNGSPILLPRSKEFMQIIDAILESQFATSDPKKACIFVPQIDLLNQNNLNLDMIERCLAALPL